MSKCWHFTVHPLLLPRSATMMRLPASGLWSSPPQQWQQHWWQQANELSPQTGINTGGEGWRQPNDHLALALQEPVLSDTVTHGGRTKSSNNVTNNQKAAVIAAVVAVAAAVANNNTRNIVGNGNVGDNNVGVDGRQRRRLRLWTTTWATTMAESTADEATVPARRDGLFASLPLSLLLYPHWPRWQQNDWRRRHQLTTTGQQLHNCCWQWEEGCQEKRVWFFSSPPCSE